MKRPADQPTDTLPVDAIQVGKRFRQTLGDIDALATSIAEHGLLHPIVVTPERDLVAGERRLVAVRQLGWTEVPVRIVVPKDPRRAEVAENTVREDFTPSEAVRYAREFEAQYAAEAKARQGTRTDLTSAQITHKSRPERTDERIAAEVGMSASTLRMARAVVDAVEANPELAPIAELMDSDRGSVDAAFRKLPKAPPSEASVTRNRLMDASPDVQLAAAQLRWATVMRRWGELLTYPPEEYVRLLDTGTRRSLEAEVSETRMWLDRIDAALAQTGGLKVVAG